MTLVLMPIIISLTSFPSISIYFFKYIVVNPYTLYFVSQANSFLCVVYKYTTRN